MGEATLPKKLLSVLLLIGLCSCQEPPQVQDLPSFVTVVEDIRNNTVLFTFFATHPNGKNILIHTVGATTENMVYINQTFGDDILVHVVTKSAFDRDGDERGLPGSDQVTLVLKATDDINNEIFLRTTLFINDVNDNVPVFRGVTYTWKLDELPFNGNETFDDINATDLDKGINGTAGIRYFMNPTTQSESTAEEYRQTFEMDNKTGKVFLKKALDYQKNSYYQFNVTARDRNGVGNIGEPVDLIIRVLDVQNSPPFFTGQPYRHTIKENIPLNSDVIKITARDGDTGVPNPVNYTILPGNCSKLFNISHDGEIRTATEIDRDAGDVKVVDGVCVLIVLVEEENTFPQEFPGNTTATTEVTITVEDVNDNVPEFENKTYTAEVQENTPNNVPITLTNAIEIKVFDIDQGINARLDLFLEYIDGSECNDFSVTPNTIQKSGSAFIKVVNQDVLDFETVKNISFLIIAKEMLNPNRSATATILLNIIDMNDNNPQFENSSYSFSVPENSNTSISVGQITATDKDSGEWGNITYSLSGGNDRFFVEQYTGVIRTSCYDCSLDLDREKADVYYLTYTATDNGGRSNSTSLVIHITDENDNEPEFTRDSYTAFIEENEPRYNSTPVVTVEAHDNDEEGTNNSKIVYTIRDVSEDKRINVTIDGSSGKIYFLQPVDFEQLKNKSGIINITVEASDLGQPPKAKNTTVVITVEDLNDNSPTFNTSKFEASVPENTSSNVSSIFEVTSVHAEDKDGTERNNKIQYFIISGAMDHFTINPNTGVVSIQINAKLNREDIPEYHITIMAIDRGYPQLNGSATLIIDILDVNDELPKFNLSEYNVDVTENSTKGTYVITCLASDPDTDSDLQYTIVDRSAMDERGANVNRSLVEGYFTIDLKNGSVYINEPPDREVAKTITLKIQAKDINAADHKPQIANVTLTVTLLDINDNPPSFTLPSYSVSVSENAQNATILLTIEASDKDENRTITYEIIKRQNESESFYLHSDSGILQKHGPLDREKKSFIVLNVSATDNGVPSLTSFTKVNVTILDFNDNAPYFVNFTDEVCILENATNHTFVHKVTALDNDTGPNANVTYSFEDITERMFAIDSLNGSITVNGSLDRESKSLYTLRIKAQDNPLNEKEQKTTLKTLTVKLVDVNDNTPQFENSNYAANISESKDIGSSVIRILATDNDEVNTNNSLVSYSFSNETAGLFRIDRWTGVVDVTNSLIGKVGSYILGLIAEDHGEPRLINSSVVNITVLDFNYNKPYITNIPSDNTIKVYECVDEGYTVYRFNYSDDDTGINAQADFNISGTDDAFNRTFNMTSDGILQVKQKLNYNNKSSYVFQVQVTDRGIPKLSSDKIQITIEVLDVDDHLPSFTEDAIPFDVKENQPAGAIVGAVTADDRDHNSVACYYFKDNNTNQIFDIGTNNGSIVTKIPLDYENKTHYSFTVGVKDCSLSGNISECGNVTHIKDPSYRETINVTVRVVDVNDNPPVFKVNEISVGMRRKTEVNTTLDISLKTNDYIEDKDTDVNGRQAWVFTNAGDIQISPSLAGKIGLQSGVMNCNDKKRHIVCVSRNGSLINNKYYSEDISGNFIVPVKVTDAAGNDTVNVKIFLISDSQILVMTLYGPKEEIAEKKNEILAIYSKVTGYTFVYDWLENHKTADGKVETFKTDLYFHVVDSKTEQALSAIEALRVVDSNYQQLLQAMQQFQVLEIVSSEKLNTEEDDSEKTIYILAAVIAVLTVSVVIIIYVSITTRNTYRRKLRAATVKPHDKPDVTEKESSFIPGSNLYSRQSNPLLDADIPEKIVYDNISMDSNNSLDSNGVGEPRKESDYDQLEEKEKRMDMFIEESNMSTESPLDEALKQYEMQNKLNKVDNNSTESVVSPNDIEALAFENTAFVGDFESTEI